jgi:hypothetical protein
VLAAPYYERLNNEAKAAKILVKIQTIALAHHDALDKDLPYSKKPEQFVSQQFGKAPPLFPGLQNLYTENDGVNFSSRVVNHSDYFEFTGHDAFPVLFIQATNNEGIALLNALDHLTGFKHSFVSANLMIVALAQNHQDFMNAPGPESDVVIEAKKTTSDWDLHWPLTH